MKMTCKHDYNLHSNLSLCSNDPLQTPEYIYAFALSAGYDSLCIADHTWDAAVPGASPWYARQPVERTCTSLPLPTGDLPFYFGCETDYCGGDKLGIAPENYDLFDFIVVPLNHFHMEGFTRPAECNTVDAVRELFTERLEQFSQLPLPWHKIGIAHLTSVLLARNISPAATLEVLGGLDPERLRPVFRHFAASGAGIELNAGCFGKAEEKMPVIMRIYTLARDCGCKFYCASDAHSLSALASVGERCPDIVDRLELREADRFHIPAKG